MNAKKKYFKIGEIADLFDLNIRTLRYYDQIDLLKPSITDPDTGYRYYSTAQFEPLNTIRYLRDLGMSLEDIRAFLKNRDVEAMKSMMHAQLAEVEQRQRDLDMIRRKLHTRLDQIERAQENPRGIVEFRTFEARRAVLLRYALSPDTDLEYPIRLLAKAIGVRGVFLGMVGLSISMQRLVSCEFENYDHIFLLLDGETADRQGRIAETEPETVFASGIYAVLRFRGTHAGAESYYRLMYDEIARQGYEIIGDSLEITLIDYGLTDDPEHFVTELQIPVRRK